MSTTGSTFDVSKVAERVNPDGTFTMRVAHLRVRARVVGEGAPLLMLMGIGGNLDMWEPLAEQLHGRQLIMFDQPGTAGSSAPLMGWSMANYAWLARGVMRKLGIDRADVLGYSWGGLLAQQFAAQYPHRVRKLVLACTAVGIGSWPHSPKVARYMITPRRYYSLETFRKAAPVIYGGRYRTDPEAADIAFANRETHKPSLLGYAAQLCASATYSAWQLGAFIGAPTMVIAGDQDPIIPTINQKILNKLVPGSRLHLVEGAGHLLLIDRPADSATAIEAFLAEY